MSTKKKTANFTNLPVKGSVRLMLAGILSQEQAHADELSDWMTA